ncbi:MAG: NAD(P)H:quinone oxidoreductase [Legionellales bacterium]|nr:NAD(P)H:quinone oxidoreductase [Legionellales bacterium]
MSDKYILVLYYSQSGYTKKMAEEIALGIDSSDTSLSAKIRTVKPIGNQQDQSSDESYATLDELKSCSGLALGSPCYFGNMAAPLKHFLDSTTSLWFNNNLTDKPAAVFTSTGSLHGGHESTLLTMSIPLIHHGMIIVGIPYTNTALIETTTGGTPYGASHMSGPSNTQPIDKIEKKLCNQLGNRLANITHKLTQS